MLEVLFEDENDQVQGSEDKSGLPVPPSPRLQCGLCGISNQGATCYLNSLLQTLLLTPEFRELLFELDEEELGSLADKDKPGVKVRIIPIQLQRLFGKLLLSDQQSVSTTELTESFGWTDNEGYQQHDVQELNRILFSAIEDSLIGTSGRGLINRLYHGTIVNQIVCLVCGKVSEREENFLDLTLSITGLDTLENGLKSCYIEKEVMDGKNQYRCERCNKLVDATKGARLRCLPEILTISLLRFSYDFVKGERYKETGKFVYPMTLNMAPYYEHAGPNDINEYELFSVVIHRGGAYGGHYHAYIKDIDGLGKWTHPDEETIQIPTDPTTGEVDFIECDCPVELIQAILHRHKDIQTVDKLCGEITKQTGVSWNKRFKKQFGPIHKFLAKYDDKFIYDPSSNHISLKDYGKSDSRGGKETSTLAPENSQEISTLVSEKQATQANVNENSPQKDGNKIGPQKDGPSRKRPPSPSPEIGQCWFDFNDSRVYPIRTKEIEWQYSGKESAYMLFYRKKSLLRPEEAMGNPAYKMPDRIISEVLEENDELHDKRMHYEIAVNLVTLQLHFGGSYQYYKGALWPLPGKCIWIDLNVDRRNTIQDLKLHAMEVGSDLICEDFVIHRMKELPAGSHLYDCVSYDDEKMLKDLSIDEGTKLFIWNGTKVGDDFVPTGPLCEPIQITVIYGNPKQLSYGFSKSLTLEEFKIMSCDLCGLLVDQVHLKKVIGDDEDRNVVSFRIEDFQKTLEELKIKDGDKIILDSSATSQNTQIDKSLLEKSKMKSKIEVHIENKCMETCDKDRSRCKIEVEINQTVGELKVMAISKFGLGDIEDGGRLKIEHDRLGLRPPLHDGSTIETAAITQGTNLILEAGPAPSSNQITLTFTPGDPRSDLPDKEIIVDRNITVGVCLQCMINKAGYNDDNWHLRKTNWCGEAAELLNDLDSTLDNSLINDGDHLLLEEGKLPPKGYIRIMIWLYKTPEKPFMSTETEKSGVLSWITSGLQSLLGSETKETKSELEYPVQLGEVEVSLLSVLEDLKIQILTLPGLENLNIPSPDFLRVRMIENERLTTILRDPNQTLQKLKLKSCSKLAIQILPQDEQLSINQIILSVKVRIPETRTYAPEVEILWDVTHGATVQSLKQTISNGLLMSSDSIKIAKHIPRRFEWMVIKETQKKPVQQQKGKKKGGQKTNLRQAPYNIQDGDVIGVMNLQLHPMEKDDFGTIEDDLGQEEMKRQIEEIRKQREERRKMEAEFDGFQKKSRRPEVALKIKVDDFR